MNLGQSTMSLGQTLGKTMEASQMQAQAMAQTSAAPPPPEGSKSVFFKDSAILRFNDPLQVGNLDTAYMQNFSESAEGIKFNELEGLKQERAPQIHVMNDNGLMNLFQRKAIDPVWKTVNCLQTCVKAQIGVGTPIVVRFYAPLDKQKPMAQIAYDYKGLGKDEDLILKRRDEKYCLKQVYKMAYYIQQLYHCEVLRMKAEFVKDDNGSIWFQFADQLWVRPSTNYAKNADQSREKVAKINEEKRQQLLQEMKECAEKSGELSQGLKAIMDNHYLEMKEVAGFNELEPPSEGSDSETEAVFKKLRPNAKHSLNDILTGKVRQPKKKLFLGRGLREHVEAVQGRQRREKMQRVNSSFNYASITTKPGAIKIQHLRALKEEKLKQLKQFEEQEDAIYGRHQDAKSQKAIQEKARQEKALEQRKSWVDTQVIPEDYVTHEMKEKMRATSQAHHGKRTKYQPR